MKSAHIVTHRCLSAIVRRRHYRHSSENHENKLQFNVTRRRVLFSIEMAHRASFLWSFAIVYVLCRTLATYSLHISSFGCIFGVHAHMCAPRAHLSAKVTTIACVQQRANPSVPQPTSTSNNLEWKLFVLIFLCRWVRTRYQWRRRRPL